MNAIRIDSQPRVPGVVLAADLGDSRKEPSTRSLAALQRRQVRFDLERAEHERHQAELLAVVAHELRKPLAPIRTAASLLNRTDTDKETLARAQAMIERQVEHMSRLVEDLLDTSRARTGKMRLVGVKADIRSIVEAAADACRPAFEQRLQRFTLQHHPSALQVHGDPVRLTQVLSNLLDNASKFTPENGEIGLSVAVADGRVVITVSDSGIGIAANELADVFEPFFQNARAVRFQAGGLGIGLSLVRELVEAHGGSVFARSAGSGKGSQFFVTLPLLCARSASKANERLAKVIDLS